MIETSSMRLHYYIVCVAGLFAVSSTTAWAIPSPDLVIGLSASVAQVLGLLSVVFTGMAFSGKKASGRGIHGDRRGGSQKWRWILPISLLLLFVSVGSNVFQFTSNVDEKNQRLQTNLVRKSVQDGQTVVDVSLKTLSLSDQIDDPLGVDNLTLSQWMQDGKALNLIDVREAEEVEMGGIAGTWHRRYPDLQRDTAGLIQEGKDTVLLCYSGNRSSELCQQFASEGKPCHFLIGGYEKWASDGLPIEYSTASSADELRSIPDYPNKDRLLDTAAVKDMVTSDGAVFIDARYPEEFQAGHLPGATNIPMRKLPTSELQERLGNLSPQPIIAACYDKRSCFYSKTLGLQLSRLGYDFRGRYTVPHEFYNAGAELPKESWTLLGRISAPLEKGLRETSEVTGHYAIGILLFVLVLRLVFLPFNWKAERDRVVQRELVPEIRKLKIRIVTDPQRLSRATMQLYRRARLTPLRNLVSSITQLVLFLIFFTVVNRAAASWDQNFLWFPNAASTDPTNILPALVTALFFGFLVCSGSRRTIPFMLLYVAGGALIWMLTHRLNVAVNLYLAVNITLLFLQNIIFRTVHAGAKRKTDSTVKEVPAVVADDPGIVSLKDAYKYPSAGQKAIRLSQLIQAGFSVPAGFVVTNKVLNRGSVSKSVQELELSRKESAMVRKQWRRLRARKVAVRSSGLNEDGTSQSYAGVFDSTLNVSKQELLQALLTVRQSMCSERSSSYSGIMKEKGGAVVQKMVEAQYAGVLFTEHPNSTGCVLVEMVSGLGEALVNGQVTPDSYRFGVVSMQLLDGNEPPINLRPLIVLGREIERLFGRPQDIEWAYSGGKFILLQARDITSSICDSDSEEAAVEIERRKLLQLAPDIAPSETFLAQNELSELLPRPTPLSASLMERLWSTGGSTDIACRSIGIPYDVQEDSPPYVTSAFGALYTNQHEESRRLRRTPGPAAAFNLARNAEAIETGFREDFLPGFLNEMRMFGAMEFNRLTTKEMLALLDDWTDQFVTKTYVRAEVINVATDFYWKTAHAKLERRSIDPALYLGNIPETIVNRAMSLLGQSRDKQKSIESFLALFGHRAPQDYELSQPRYSESPDVLLGTITHEKNGRSAAINAGSLPTDPVLRLAVDRAKRFQVLKEDAKHHCLRQLALLRRLLLVLDNRLVLDGGIFYLTLEEVMELDSTGGPLTQVRALVAQRQGEAEIWKKIRLPSELSIRVLEDRDILAGTGGTDISAQSKGSLKGKRVAGTGDVVGFVRVMHNPEDIKDITPDDIVVARFTDTTWYPLFPVAGGIVTEVGGWLSHAAIVAREHNLTAIVGVKAASEILKTGELVRLGADGSVEVIEDRRSSDSLTRSRRGDDGVVDSGMDEEPSVENEDPPDADNQSSVNDEEPHSATGTVNKPETL